MTKFTDPSFSSPANSSKFRDNFDRIFGKKKKCKWHDGDQDPFCNKDAWLGRDYCALHLEQMGIEVENPETD